MAEVRHSADSDTGDDIAVDGLALETGEQEVVLVASVPLTDEPWRPLEEGEIIALRNGRIVATTMG